MARRYLGILYLVQNVQTRGQFFEPLYIVNIVPVPTVIFLIPMPQTSTKVLLLEVIQQLEDKTIEVRSRNLQDDEGSSSDSSMDSQASIIITPPTTILPLSPFSESNWSDELSESSQSIDSREMQYDQLLGAIQALCDEVARAHVLNWLAQPLLCVS